MKKVVIALMLFIPTFMLFGQTSKSVLIDTEITSKLQKIKDNIDNMFETFKSNKQPDPEVNFDDSFITNIKLYNVYGSTSTNDFDNNLSFRISTNDYKKATKADFEKVYSTIEGKLKTLFDYLAIREKKTEDMNELTMYEMGKDPSQAVASPKSPKYYISLKYKEEKVGKKTSYSIFLYFTTKK